MCGRDLATLGVALEHSRDSSHHAYPSKEAKGKAGRKEGCGKSPSYPKSERQTGGFLTTEITVCSNAALSEEGSLLSEVGTLPVKPRS